MNLKLWTNEKWFKQIQIEPNQSQSTLLEVFYLLLKFGKNNISRSISKQAKNLLPCSGTILLINLGAIVISQILAILFWRYLFNNIR